MFNPPSPEEAQAILAANAHRYPQRAKIPVLGDGGARVALPVILGLPSGACRMPASARPSPVWQAIVSGLINQNLDNDGLGDRLVEDCVLWPDLRTFATWRARWPALANNLGVAILRMVGATIDCLVEPSVTEEPPDAVAQALAAHPRAVWRRVVAGGAKHDVAIDTPDAVRFDAFSDAIRHDDQVVSVVREFAEAQIVACAAVGGTAKASDLLDRAPGLSVLVAAQARRLGGAQGEIELGGW